MVPLCAILFTGGMDTKFKEIRPVLMQGVLLSGTSYPSGPLRRTRGVRCTGPEGST